MWLTGINLEGRSLRKGNIPCFRKSDSRESGTTDVEQEGDSKAIERDENVRHWDEAGSSAERQYSMLWRI